MSNIVPIDERLRPLVDTATQVIYWSEHCVVAYGPLLSAGMGVRFEVVSDEHQHGLGFTVASAAGRMAGIAARAGEQLAEKVPEHSGEIEAGVAALSTWQPFATIGAALDQLTAGRESAN